jgi:hypothetical protein
MLSLLNKNNINMPSLQNGTNILKLSTYDLNGGVRSTSLDDDENKLFNDDTNGVLKKAKRPYGDGKGRKKRGRERDRDR